MVKVIQDLQSLCIRIAWCRIYATIWRMGQYLESIRKVNALSKWKYDTLRVIRLPQNGFTFFRFRALSNSIPLSGIVSTPPFPILLLKTSFKLAPIDFSCTGWAEKMITTAVLSTRWPRPFFGERNVYVYLLQFWSYTKILEYGKVWEPYISFNQIKIFS